MAILSFIYIETKISYLIPPFIIDIESLVSHFSCAMSESGHHMKSKRYNRRALSAMMYSKDNPRIYLDGPCLVHNKKIKAHSKSSGEAMDFDLNKDDMFHMQAIRRERSASLPSADISVRNRIIIL